MANLTPKELEDLFKRRRELEHYKNEIGKRGAEKQKHKIADAEEAANYKNELDEKKRSSRATKQGDWYSIMIAMFETMIVHAKAMHASSSAKRLEDAISSPIKEIYGEAKGWITDSLSWSVEDFLKNKGLKGKEKLPDITVDIKIDPNKKDGSFTCKAMVNGSIPLEDYFLDDDDSHTPGMGILTPRQPKTSKEIADKFEKHFKDGFELWLESKGCSIKDQKIMDTDGTTPLTQARLGELNKGAGNLSEFLSDLTKLNVTADPNDLPDSRPTPLPITPKPGGIKT